MAIVLDCRSFGGTTVANNMVFVPCTDGIRAIGSSATGTMQVLWHAEDTITGSPVLGGGRLWSLLAVSSPRANHHADPNWPVITTATAATFAAAALIVVIGRGGRRMLTKRTGVAVESASLAAAAGVMYALQDVATRGAIVATHHHNLAGLLVLTMWPWVLLGAATAGVLLSQAAFRIDRLDYALPPTAAAQPVAGVILGVTLLGDNLTDTGVSLAVEALCLAAMLGAVVLVGRAPTLKPHAGSGVTSTARRFDSPSD